MGSLLSLVKNHGTQKNTVTTVTGVTAAPVLASHGNRTNNATVTTVTWPLGNSPEVTAVTMHKKTLLPKKVSYFGKITEVTEVTVKNDESEFFTPSDDPQGTRLEFIKENAPLGLRQLRDLLQDHSLSLSQTPKGQLFPWGEPPLHLDALGFLPLVIREVRAELRELGGKIPVMEAAFAHELIDRLEETHIGEGFYVKPQWRGLSIPENWTPMVGLSLQSLFLCASYAPEVFQ